MVAAAVAVERRARFQRVDHEAQTRAAGGEEVGFVGAGAAGGGVGHLCGVTLVGEEGGGGRVRGGGGNGMRRGSGRGVRGGREGGGYLFPDVGLGVGVGCRGEGLWGHCAVVVAKMGFWIAMSE